MIKYVTKNQIKALYRKKLKPRLRQVERERKKVKGKITFVIIIFLFIACIASGILMKSSRNLNLNIIIPIFVVAIVLSGFIIRFLTKDYRNNFKQNVIKEMFDLLLQKSNFNPQGYINDQDFNRCHLITERYNRYNGEDYVTGNIGHIGIEFSELHVRHVTGSGKNRSDVTRFKGLFFKCTFDNNIKTPILIHSDTAERFFGRSIGRFFQKYSQNGYDLVQLESPEFEKIFAVYSKDQVQARVILNPLTMDRLTQFIKRYKEKIEISVIDNNLYFLVHSSKNYFEPKIFSDALKWKDVMAIYDLLSLITELVNQFNLNKRVKSNVS